jgi:hypothetical protein
MSWLIFILTFIALSLITLKLRWIKDSFLSKPFILFVFSIKVIFGSLLVLIYTHYYPDRNSADIYKFFDDATVIADALPNDPGSYFKLLFGVDEQDPILLKYTSKMKNWDPQSSEWLEFTQTENYNIFQSNRIITRINAFLMPLSLGNIYTHVLYFSWFILICSISFLNILKSFSSNSQLAISIFTLLFPSVILWCSAPLKDTLTLSAVSLLFVSLFHFVAEPKNRNFIQHSCFVLAILVVLYTKYYVLIAFFPAALLYLTLEIKNKIKKRIALISLSVLTVAFLFVIPNITEKFDPVSILNNKREEALKAAIFGEANHLIFEDLIDEGIQGLILESPNAVANALYRPFISEKSESILVKVASLENLLLLILSIPFGIILVRKRKINHLIAMYLTYVVILAFIIGYTTPVAGGIMRYKTALLPAYFAICLHDINLPRFIVENKLFKKIESLIMRNYDHSSVES